MSDRISPESSRLTPYDDEYQTCERAVATFLMNGDHLNPAIVSAKLGLEPTSQQFKGQVFTNSLARQRVARHGGWYLSSEHNVQSKDLRRHLDYLLDRLHPVRAAVLELQREEGVTMAISCNWWSAHGGGGPALWPEQMARMAELNLEFMIAFSYYGPEDAGVES